MSTTLAEPAAETERRTEADTGDRRWSTDTSVLPRGGANGVEGDICDEARMDIRDQDG